MATVLGRRGRPERSARLLLLAGPADLGQSRRSSRLLRLGRVGIREHLASSRSRLGARGFTILAQRHSPPYHLSGGFSESFRRLAFNPVLFHTCKVKTGQKVGRHPGVEM